MSEFVALSEEVHWEGRFLRTGGAWFRHGDGAPVWRDKVWHPGAVGVLAVDDEHVWLTRQPREVIGVPDSLEIVAGKLDVAGEPPRRTAERELAEEIGKAAGGWRELFDFYASGGFTDERIWLYLATELTDAATAGTPAHGKDERITVIPWPLTELAGAIAQTRDAKTLIALLWLQREVQRQEASGPGAKEPAWPPSPPRHPAA
jgi:ADP-ribose pyrophosphatase